MFSLSIDFKTEEAIVDLPTVVSTSILPSGLPSGNYFPSVPPVAPWSRSLSSTSEGRIAFFADPKNGFFYIIISRKPTLSYFSIGLNYP